MKYFLSIEFYNQGEPTNLKIGDSISFISLQRKFKSGIITEIKYMKDSTVPIPSEYKVNCQGIVHIALLSVILKF